MATRDLNLAMKLLLDSQQFVRGLTGSRGAVTKFTAGVKNEFAQLRTAFDSVQGKLAAIGVGVGGVATMVQSARLDKSLGQIALTAGVGAGEIEKLRTRLFALSQQTGKPIEDLQAGFNALVQSGLSFDQALATMNGINQAMAVTGADANTLASAITVAGEAFKFDLSNPQMAVTLLEKMTVAGRLGNAELEDLSGIFARVGVNASSAGMSFDKTLAFIEGLSKIEKQPERLSTLADSTLRIFTNARYRQAAEQATGVKFFDKGARRDAMAVLDDIKKKYATLTSDESRENFISKAFGNADADTIKGLRTLLGGEMLTTIAGFDRSVAGAAGTFAKDMDAALDNAVDQAGRLKSTLREAADGFVRPINKALADAAQKILNKKEDGGLGLNGTELFGVGAAAIVGGYALKRLGIPGLGTAGGVAAGKALEQAAGVTPVYVTNYAQFGSAGASAAGSVAAGAAASTVFSKVKALTVLLARTPLKSLATWGAGGLAAAGGMVAASGLAGWGVGSAAYKWQGDNIQKGIMNALAYFGNDRAQLMKRQDMGMREWEGSLKIELDDKRTVIKHLRSNSPSMNIDFDNRGLMGSFQ